MSFHGTAVSFKACSLAINPITMPSGKAVDDYRTQQADNVIFLKIRTTQVAWNEFG